MIKVIGLDFADVEHDLGAYRGVVLDGNTLREMMTMDAIVDLEGETWWGDKSYRTFKHVFIQPA